MSKSSETNTQVSRKRINNTTLAYIAGILDGEGYFTGVFSGCTTSDEKYGAIRVHVVNCRRDLLEWLQSLFGGTITDKKKGPWSRHQCYDWHVGESVRFLRMMKPYVRLKRPQLEVALAFFSLPYAPQKRRKLAEKIRRLNQEQYELRDEDIVRST
jgi:hypothetical protein